ncbi:MAG: UDP-N-acetylglucosamine--N-acetylmuramyl-(pentapeptide) pyrophosphoryl-undecaprenol N-acetylglucosamine transferase [Candidatus Dadabacteria bacterium]|nr:UDP-N-acetylglucosamine--N-acetylmuramyl-(pentapeptide) pyrophosphoryl-undecaprenol N-acetylglucosamine transferase [Candidatus Dadabacteria bacterium]NIS07564.1 UDP-N-acetylglucosamine--N-acetylmuramyl-(pentapeptide) pyrophosphoryl-undecaprenol N-acetylglucosamine transferase [Candidatus Dadabacteria bacterium]NIY21179.1 hypothetical protein [Candidatus Dadabacteria bacterium]
MEIKIGYFISPHGFGHAARAAAIMESLNSLNKNIEFEIFTLVPPWFFINSGISNFNYHELLTDIGLVQKSALQEDLQETIVKLDDFIPFDDSLIDSISKKLVESDCKLVICDISPLGLEIAKRANIRSVLIENFTWDWIYSQYNYEDITLNGHIDYLNNIYNSAGYRIKTKPICFESSSNLLTNPVSRKSKTDRSETRKALQVSEDQKVVMITMGGIPSEYDFFDKLKQKNDITFIIPGGSDKFEINDNLVLIPHMSDFFHPDLINASDAVIGKVGYSTLAEVYNSGVPFGYILRPQFPESEPLHKFILEEMNGIEISDDEFYSRKWLNYLDNLISLPRINRTEDDGADQAANFIYNLL